MKTPKNTVALIDTEQIVRKVNKGKLLPGPVMRFIKKLLHEEDFNRNFRDGYLGLEFVEHFFDYIDIKVEVVGEENIPAEGLFTFASNHPLGGADAGFQVAYFAKRYNGNVCVPANNFLMHLKQLSEYLIPVNKMGANSRELAQLLSDAFHSDKQMLFFPAGVCSRRINGVVTDLPWKKTFITKSRETRRAIIPVWFSGQNSKRFYRISDLCHKLGIKTNFAMYTLPDELFRCRGKRFRMVIGKPIPWTTFTPDKTDTEWAAWVREQVYALAEATTNL